MSVKTRDAGRRGLWDPGVVKFTGKIVKVTVDLKEMKAADKAEEEKARAVAAHKKALSD